jgi:very-short-patch-repair endonuclease
MKLKGFVKSKIAEHGTRQLVRHIKRRYPERYGEIIASTVFITNPKSFSERLYCILNDIREKVMCKQCHIMAVSFGNFKTGYHTYCSKKCKANSEEIKLQNKTGREKTMMLKYGVKSLFCIKGFAKKTMLKKYGVEHSLQMKPCLRKREQTNLVRYGDKVPMNVKSVQDKKKATTLRRYGVEHNAQSEDCLRKMRETNLRKYGFESCMQNPHVIQKSRRTKIRNGTVKSIYPAIGKNEKAILDRQEKIDGCKIDRGFSVLTFRPDGYCHKTNTVYEVYEKKHRFPKQKKKDRERQTKITRKLKCKFVILWDLTH